MSNVNQAIFDELVEHQLDVFKVDASLRKEVDRRLLRLKRDIKAAMEKHAPAEQVRRDSRMVAGRALTKAVRELVRKAYSDIDDIVGEEVVIFIEAESKAVAASVEAAVDGL